MPDAPTRLDLTRVEVEISKLLAETSKLIAETSKLNSENAKFFAEAGKPSSENAKFFAETGKLNAENSKLSRETRFYPLVVSAGVGGAIAAITAAALKVLGDQNAALPFRPTSQVRPGAGSKKRLLPSLTITEPA